MFKQCPVLTTMVIVSCVAFSAAGYAADTQTSLKLKTSIEEVNGVREIEAGNYDAGIRKTEAVLAVTTVKAQRAPLLNNLCVAQIATGNLQAAEQTCNDAVDARRKYAIAYNNRAVLNCLADQREACIEDFKKARQYEKNSQFIETNLQTAGVPELFANN